MEDHNSSTSNSNNILQDAANFSSNTEWSVTSSAFDKSDAIDNSPTNTETLKKLWSNSMDVEDCVVVKTPDVNITNFNDDDTNYLSICKPTAFNKKHKSNINNDSVLFENALTDDCQMDVTQSSVCSNRFQKRKRLLPSNNDEFVELNRSDNSGIDSAEVSMNAPKFQYKKKSNDQSINLPSYSLSSTDGGVVTDSDDSNVSEVNKNAVFKKPLDSSIFESDCSSVMNVYKTEVSANKFTKKNIDIVDTAFDNAINDWSMISNITSPKNKSLNNKSTATLQEISKCRTKVSTHKFTTKNIDVVDGTEFDNAIKDCSMVSNITSPKNESLINISIKNVQEISKCSTMSENMSCLNHTYDVPVKYNHLQLGLSQSAKNNNESSNDFAIEPTNETYTLKNDSLTNKSNYNVSLSLGNAKNTLSDTYTIGNNINDSFSQQNSLQSTNKSTNTLTDISCIHSQPNSSIRKHNFMRKLPLDEVSHNFTLTNDDNDITDSDEINKTKIIDSNKFKLKKTYHEADSQMFDNIITSSQEMEMSTYESVNCSKNNLSNMASTKIVNKNVPNISLESRSERDIDTETDKSSTQQSNIVLCAITENDINISKSLLLKYNTPNSGHRVSGKFNFSRQFGRHSLSFQEKRENCHKVKQHSISFNIARNNSKMLNSFHNPTSNIDVESCSEICTIPENDTHSIKSIVSLSPEIKSASHEVENNGHELTLSQNNTFQSKLHFAGGHNLNAHSGVFSDLIDNSVNSDISLNVSKQVKFKTQQNISKEADSMVFENIITDTQESSSTRISNGPLSHTILCDQSKMINDEISIFANIDELWSNKKTPRSAEYSLTKLNPAKILNLEDNGFKDKANILNNKSNDSPLKHRANESYEDKLSVMSVNENNTYCEQNDLLLTDKSINSPLSNTARLSGNNCHSYYQTRSISKSLLTPKNSDVSYSSYKTSEDESNLLELDAPKINSNSKMAHISKHSRNESCNDKKSSVLLNSFESSENNGSREDRLKRTFSSMNSYSSSSNNEGLTLINTTIESMDIDQSQQNQSKRRSESITHKQSTSLNSSTKSLKSCNISKNILDSSVSYNNELSFNSSVKSSKSYRSSNQSISNNSLINITNTNDISNISNTSLKLEDASNINDVLTSNYGLPENSGLSLLKTTSEFREQKLLFTNQSEKSNLVKLEDRTTNISRMSTRSSKQKDNSNSTDNISLEVSNINHVQSKSEGSLKLKNISAFSEQKKSLLNNSKQSVVFGDETRNDFNDSRLSTRSSTQINLPIKDVEPKVLNSSHGVSLNKESFKLKNTSLFLEQKEPSLKKSKQFISIVTENDYNDSVISTRLSTGLNHSIQNINSGVSNISHGLSENEESLKNTSVCFENKTKNDNYNSRISTRSSTRKTRSLKDVSHGLSENEDSLKLQNASSFSEQKTSPLNKSIQFNSVVSEKETKIDNDHRISNVKLGTLCTTHTLSEKKESSKDASTFLKQTESSLNKLHISNWLENAPNDDIIDRSTLSNHFVDNENPEVSNSNIDGHILMDEKSSMLNKSSVTSKPINSSLNQHKRCNPIILENETNNVSDTSKISTRSSKRKKHVNEFEPEISVITDNLKKNKSSLKNSTRVTRSASLSGSINDPLLPLIVKNKSSKSIVNNMNDHSVRCPTNLAYFNDDNVVDETLSTHFSRSSKSGTQYSNVSVNSDTMTRDNSFIRNIADLSNKNIDNETDDSVFWTTLSENSTLQSSTQTSVKLNKFQSSCRKNDFQTPTTTLSIAERIASKIGIMSESRRKVTHPGAFELLDPINLPPTRSLTQRQASQSPSILSRVLGKNDKLEDLSFSQTSDSVVDQLSVENTVKEKMKSLYNKEPWITKRLYNFLVSKLQPKYHIYAVKYAEKFVKYLASILNQVYNDKVDLQLYADMLRYHMARYEIIKDTFDYIEFLTDFIPRPFYDKLTPGWDLETSEVKFDPLKNYLPIMKDEEFLREVLENLNK